MVESNAQVKSDNHANTHTPAALLWRNQVGFLCLERCQSGNLIRDTWRGGKCVSLLVSSVIYQGGFISGRCVMSCLRRRRMRQETFFCAFFWWGSEINDPFFNEKGSERSIDARFAKPKKQSRFFKQYSSWIKSGFEYLYLFELRVDCWLKDPWSVSVCSSFMRCSAGLHPVSFAVCYLPTNGSSCVVISLPQHLNMSMSQWLWTWACAETPVHCYDENFTAILV